MTSVVRTRLFTFVAGLIIVPIGTVMAVMFARGYRPDLQKRQITLTGILSAHTYPENANIYIDRQKVSSVTNANLSLDPGNYQIEFKKEGYFDWKKDMLIEKEVVTTATAILFPTVPTLKPINNFYSSRVVLSPDGTKVIYLSKTNQVFSLDLSESPLGMLNRESRLIGSLPAGLTRANLSLTWSPDSRQVLITDPIKNSSASALLVDLSSQKITSVADSVSYLRQSWQDKQDTQHLQMLQTLPPILKNILATTSANLNWSPRENKLLYTATASAVLPDRIKKPLPGSSTQTQNRTLQPGKVYVYDLEEDRNFYLDETIPVTPTPKQKTKSKLTGSTISVTSLPINAGWSWFPTSSHLYRITTNQIILIEYDSQNRTVVYSGPLFEDTAIPYPSGKQMLLLTRFETTPPASGSADPSLYALNLR